MLKHLIVGCFCGVSLVQAQTLPEVMTTSLQQNMGLKQAQESVKAVHEAVPLARAGYLPNIALSGSVSAQHQSFDAFDDDNTPESYGLSLSQPLYRGGRTLAALRGAKAQVVSAHAGYYHTVQDLLLNTVIVYSDVVQAQEVLRLSEHNQRVLAKYKEAAEIRFEVGESTITDVAQAESRLARAQSDVVQAQGALKKAQAQFERVVQAKAPISLSMPTPATSLPKTLQTALELAKEAHPLLHQNKANIEVEAQNARATQGQLFPILTLDGSASYQREPSFALNDDVESQTIGLNLNIPLYQGGAVYAGVRQARARAKAAQYQYRDNQQAIDNSVTQSWSDLQTANATIAAAQANVKAASLALDGVSQEQEVGTRTVLDVLDAEQELFAAKVSEVTARRNAVVASYNVLASTGQLLPQKLGIDLPDSEALTHHYHRVDHKLFGF